MDYSVVFVDASFQASLVVGFHPRLSGSVNIQTGMSQPLHWCCLINMVRIEVYIDLNYEVDANGADFIFNIHAANRFRQTVVSETLTLSQNIPAPIHEDPLTGNRYMRLCALPGWLGLRYAVTLDIEHHFSEPGDIAEVPVRLLPPDVIGYIYPSRYCQSDRFIRLAINEFGAIWKGYDRVCRIRDWVRSHVKFMPNTTNSNTSAADTLIEQVGVCRDFAHLMIALCRALNIPARFVTGTDFGADPTLGPPDFHAYVEVFLGDRWYLFDPSGTAIPMGLVRFGTGRDAADVAYATIFGNVVAQPPIIRAQAIVDPERGMIQPYRCLQAISTL